ncbi:MAG: ATP-dependent DNA ligase, partial [Candidatus Woesearchaeota archaeon]
MAKRSKSVSKNPEDKVGFRDFTNVFEKLEKITSDNSLREHVSDFVQGLSSEEVRIFSYFVLGKIGPDFDDIDLGLAEKMVKRALSEKFGKSLKDIDSVLKKTGDLGEVAEKFSAAKGADLTPGYVFDMLWRIQKAGGEGSQEKKLDILKKILDYASGIEACYVIRIVLGKLRLGVGEKTLISAFSHAFSKADDKPEEVKSVIEDKYNIDPDIGSVGRIMSKSGLSGIKRIRISIGRPIVPMLAQRINSFDNLLKKMPEDIAAEEKYDGERVQIHKDDDKVILFSRRLGNISSQYPEIVDASKKNIKAEKCILDGEIVPFEKNKIGTFQELMQRRRKYDVEKYAKEIPVAVFLFDLLYLEGKSCIRKSYPKRRKLLESVIDKSRYIKLAGRIVSQDISKIREFFKKCLDKGLEGIIE